MTCYWCGRTNGHGPLCSAAHRSPAASIAAARRVFAQRHLMPWDAPCPWPPPDEADRRYNVSAAQRAVARKVRGQCRT